MNLLSAITRHHTRLAAMSFLRRKHEARAPYKGADKVAARVAVVTLAAMLLLWSVPESEFTIWLRLTVLYFVYVCIGGCIVAATVLLFAGSAGQAIVEAYHSGRRTHAEIKALPAAEQTPAVEATTQDPQVWSYPGGKPKPYLTDDEKRAIEAYLNPKLNTTTGSQIKAGFAAGMSAADIALALNLSENLVRRYTGIFNRGKDAALSVEFE